MAKKYKVEKITDVFAIPQDRFDDFLVDLKTYRQLGEDFSSLIDAVSDINGIKTKTIPQYMVWIDDGKHDAKITLIPKEDDHA